MAHYPKIDINSSLLGYRNYVCQLSQYGTNPPVDYVLRNTLGYAPTWSRSSAGLYVLTAGVANIDFQNEDNNKVVVFFETGHFPFWPMEIGYMAHATWSREDNTAVIATAFYDGSSTGYSESDDLLSDGNSDDYFRASFELRIYN